MQSIPVDTARLGALMCVVAPEPKITNRDTGEVKVNRDGVTVWTVGVSVRQAGSRRASIIEIAVPGEPAGLTEGMRVHVADLEAFSWAQGDRHGISYRAVAVTPETPGAPPAPPASGPLRSAMREAKCGDA